METEGIAKSGSKNSKRAKERERECVSVQNERGWETGSCHILMGSHIIKESVGTSLHVSMRDRKRSAMAFSFSDTELKSLQYLLSWNPKREPRPFMQLSQAILLSSSFPLCCFMPSSSLLKVSSNSQPRRPQPKKIASHMHQTISLHRDFSSQGSR